MHLAISIKDSRLIVIDQTLCLCITTTMADGRYKLHFRTDCTCTYARRILAIDRVGSYLNITEIAYSLRGDNSSLS